MFILFDREEKYLHEITPLKAINKEVLNGEDTLQISLNADVEVEKKYRIVTYIKKYDIWKEFIVEEIEEDRTEGTLEIYAESSFYELLGDYVEDKRATDTTANIALAKVLEPTRWEVGIVDDLGISTENFYHISSKEAVQKIAKAWKGEIQTRIEITGKKITHRYVDLFVQLGDFLGERFVTGENIEKIKRTVHSDPVCTALYGYGKGEEVGDGYGRRLDFADINNGKAYVEDNEARLKWGRPNEDGTKSHIFYKKDFDDIEDKQELKQATEEELERLSKPNITYEGEIIGASARLGDTVILIDETYKPELRLTARVYEIENDLLEEENSKPVLGNFIPDISDTMNKQEEYINNFRDKSGVWDRADIINQDGTINTQYLDGAIDVLKNKLNSTTSDWYTDDKGALIFENKTENSAMKLTGKGFMIADSKDVNGNWDFRTFGTGKGFVADEIITGLLKGGKVKFDLTNGTLLIGNSIEDYSLLFDGSSLRIRLSDGKTIEETVITKVEEEIEKAPIYEWTKYADDINGTNISDDPLNKKYIGKAYNKNSQIESNNPDDYTWTISNYYVDNKIDNVSNNLDNFQNDVSTTFKDGIIEESEAKAVEKYINTLQSQQQQIYKMHQSIYNNEHLTGTYKVEENTAYNNYITAFNNLIDYINNVISDGKTTTTEKQEVDARFIIYKDRIAAYQEKLNNAQEFIQSEIKRKAEEFATSSDEKQQEVINEQTQQLAVDFNSSIQATAESVTNTMRAEYQDADGKVIEAYEKKIKETAEAWKLSFSQLTNDYAGLNGQMNEVTSYFNFGFNLFEIALSDSKVKLQLQNNKFAIVDNGVASQWFDNQNAYIKNLIVENDAQLGNHMFKKNGTKTLIQWAGDE
ncbi:phage tail spike protein [Senegalia massiliensis]|uniref:phage tail spike protein n=1 Tax=Senegalia massiliensis TaxID=1720316 RepID=UPI00103237DC|nr:phage tail spike protein [Senegalia massiliensis]